MSELLGKAGGGLAAGVGGLFDLLLAPFAGAPAWGMVFVSALAGVALLLLFKAATPQARLAAARRRLTGHIYELGLFRDDLPVLLRIQRDLAAANLRYLGATAPSLLVLLLPVVLILGQLDARWAHRPLLPGETALVTATVAPAELPLLDQLDLGAPEGLRVESAPVRDHRAGTATWRVRAVAGGDHAVRVQAGLASWSKRLPVLPAADGAGTGGRSGGADLVRLAPVRERPGWHQALFNPAEPPLPADSPLLSIAAELPDRRTEYAGVALPWLGAFCLFSLLVGFALKDAFRVEV